MLALLSRWSDVEKATYLATSLKGLALTVLNNLPPESLYDYDILAAAWRLALVLHIKLRCTECMWLKTHTHRCDVSVSELAENIESLSRLFYPDAAISMLGGLILICSL